MKKFSLTLLVMLSVFLMNDTLYAQFGFDWNILGSGARARGMGGAFIGTADDATAISWNPAGLVRLETPEASLVGIFTARSYALKEPGQDEAVTLDDWNQSHFNLNFVSIAYPLSMGTTPLVGAIAYQRVIDMYEANSSEDFGYNYESTGGIDAITPGFGIQLNPMFSVGAALNIYLGKRTTKTEYVNSIQPNEEYEYDWSGNNINIGLMADFQTFRLGFVYKTPFDLHVKYKPVDGDESEGDYTMPGMLGIGAALNPVDNLTLAADIEIRNYSNVRIKQDDQETDPEWENVTQLRLGAEYLLMSGTAVLPLRLGLKTEPKTYKDGKGDQVMGVAFTAGGGLIMGNLNFDLTGELGVATAEWQDGSELGEVTFNILASAVIHLGQ